MSSARAVSRPFGSATGSASITATSPIRTIARACSPSTAPMSMCIPLISAALLRSSPRSRWIGFLPITPLSGPRRVSRTTRCPTRTCASQPPTSPNHRKPSSSMWVTIRPISSMWPITSRRREAPRAPLRRGTSARACQPRRCRPRRSARRQRATRRPERSRSRRGRAPRAARAEPLEPPRRRLCGRLDGRSARPRVCRRRVARSTLLRVCALACVAAGSCASRPRSTNCRIPPWRK